MDKPRQSRRTYPQMILLVLLALVGRSVPAQQPIAPYPATLTLEDILHHLEANLHQYRKFVPNFYCSEHVVSSLTSPESRQYEATDSTFRVARSRSGELLESREINAVNGSPVSRKQLGGPAILLGVFNGGLATVSEGEKSCMHYDLQPMQPGHPEKPFVIHFSTLPEARQRPECILKDDGAGRVFVDPTSLQVTRMELQAPHHRIETGEIGVWKISVDYAPVVLAGQTFWMPKILNSTLITNGAHSLAVYSYLAHYYDYHKLEVTSRILPSQ
jgi:hypothetical protein